MPSAAVNCASTRRSNRFETASFQAESSAAFSRIFAGWAMRPLATVSPTFRPPLLPGCPPRFFRGESVASTSAATVWGIIISSLAIAEVYYTRLRPRLVGTGHRRVVLQRDLYHLYHLYREGWVIHQRHGSARTKERPSLPLHFVCNRATPRAGSHYDTTESPVRCESSAS